MTISLAEYNEWLEQTEGDRCLLVILLGWTGTGEQAFYFSSKAFNSKPTDSLPNISFDPRIQGEPKYSRTVPFMGTRGEFKAGTIELVNHDGELNDFLNYSFAGRSIRLLLGDATWGFDDFNAYPFMVGTIASLQTTESVVTINLVDCMGKIDKPVQTTLISTGQATGKPAPLALGQLRGISPVLINPNESGGRYKIHTGQIYSISQVYDNGNPVAGFTPYLSLGEFVLTVPAQGTVTVDCQGAVYNGVWISTAAKLVEYLIRRENYLPSNEIDSTSFSALDSAKPYVLGYYIKEGSGLISAIEAILASVNAGFYFNRTGILCLGYTLNPSTQTASKTIENYQIISFEIKSSLEIVWRQTLNYQKNWTVLNTVAGSVAATTKDWLQTEWRTVTAESTTVKNTHLASVASDAIPSYLDSSTNAQTEVNQRLNIQNNVHYEVQIKLASGTQFNPYEVVSAFYDGLGFEDGKNIQILEIEDEYLTGDITVTGWF